MMDKTLPSQTVTGKPDDAIGKPDRTRTGDRQTPEQAAITGTGEGGRTDADRQREMRGMEGQAGRNPSPIGGSSSGHSDQTSATDQAGKVAQGHYEVEKER